ncbi:MAG: hypothetical protein N2249_06890 [Melioribacter sp.]|nr:hypothetical protein [Melioribacter sp.]
MRMYSYSDDEEKFSKLLADLKELPKIKAEENFEYNLMIRIQNRNFGNLLEDSKPQYNIIKFAVPTTLIAFLILFIIFVQRNNEDIENPLMSDPPKILENRIADNYGANLSSTDQLPPKPIQEKSKKGSLKNEFKGVNEISSNSELKYPLNRNRSVSLDDYISGGIPRNNNLERGSIVKGGQEDFDFEGFLIPQPLDYNSLQKYKRMIDSIKRVEVKRDSLRRFR